MYERPLLDVSDAMAAVEAMLEAAPGASDKPLAVAVVDHWGDLMGFARMDRATPFACQYAIKKAYTAARMRSDVRGLGESLRSQGRSVAEFADPSLVSSMGGGLVITNQSEVVGGIGVSGGTPDEDETVARAGLRALGL